MFSLWFIFAGITVGMKNMYIDQIAWEDHLKAWFLFYTPHEICENLLKCKRQEKLKKSEELAQGFLFPNYFKTLNTSILY